MAVDKRINYAIQGGGPNYLGKQKMVKAPKKWKSSPTHPEAHLAYITDKEQDLLIKKNLYGSLKGKPNKGPSGIVSLQGDLGGYSGGQGGGKSGGGEGKGGAGSGSSTPWRDTKQYEVLTRGQYNPETRSFKDDRIARGARGAWTSPHLQPDAQKFGFDARQINRRRGLGGILGALGRGALSIFGGIPGKLMSGIMTAKNWAKKKGTGFMKGVGEFAEYDEAGNPLYPTLDRFINRHTGKYDDKPYLGQGQSNYTFGGAQEGNNLGLFTNTLNQPYVDEGRIGEHWRQPQNNNLGVNNQFVEEDELYPTAGLGAAEGGRIGYERGRVVNPGGYQGEEEGVDSVKHAIMLEQMDKLEKMIASGLDSDGRLQARLDQLIATPTTGFGTGPDLVLPDDMAQGGIARLL
jgi:hypothetical protein